MFWSDWGVVPKIERCGMNGDPATRESIVTNNIMWPNALSIDYTLNRLWWADAKLRTIESANLDGTQRRIILGEDVHHPFALTLFHDTMYWTDWDKEAIYQANKFTGKDRITLRERVSSPMDIHVYHEMRQPRGTVKHSMVETLCQCWIRMFMCQCHTQFQQGGLEPFLRYLGLQFLNEIQGVSILHT